MSEYMSTWETNYEKSYYFILGLATGRNLMNTLKALKLAKKFHEGQHRKGGAEYLVHPIRVCSYLTTFEYYDDILLSSALLHDAVEDSEILRSTPELLMTEYGMDKEVFDLVMLLTKTGKTTDEYYDAIKKDVRACLIKLSDRCNNVSTMSCFTREKMEKYIKETREYILPLCHYVKLQYPEYSNTIVIMKYHITSNCDLVNAFLLGKMGGENK